MPIALLFGLVLLAPHALAHNQKRDINKFRPHDFADKTVIDD